MIHDVCINILNVVYLFYFHIYLRYCYFCWNVLCKCGVYITGVLLIYIGNLLITTIDFLWNVQLENNIDRKSLQYTPKVILL